VAASAALVETHECSHCKTETTHQSYSTTTQTGCKFGCCSLTVIQENVRVRRLNRQAVIEQKATRCTHILCD